MAAQWSMATRHGADGMRQGTRGLRGGGFPAGEESEWPQRSATPTAVVRDRGEHAAVQHRPSSSVSSHATRLGQGPLGGWRRGRGAHGSACAGGPPRCDRASRHQARAGMPPPNAPTAVSQGVSRVAAPAPALAIDGARGHTPHGCAVTMGGSTIRRGGASAHACRRRGTSPASSVSAAGHRTGQSAERHAACREPLQPRD